MNESKEEDDPMATKWIRRMALSLVLVTVLVAAGGCTYLLPKEEETLTPPLVATKEVTYTTTKVTRGDVIEEKRGNGSLRSATSYSLCFETSGTISEIPAQMGTLVKEGDVLIEMTSKGLQYQYDVASLRFEKQQLQFTKISGSFNRQLAEYDLKVAEMELDYLAEQIEATKLRSPISGKITYMAEMKIGDAISPYRNIITVSDPKDLYAVVTGESAYYFVNGREVSVRIKSDTFTGICVQSPDDEPNVMDLDTSLAYAVFKVTDVPDDLYTLGRECSVSMISNSRYNVLTIPTNVLHEYGDRTYVLVLQDGVKVERDIVVGLKANNMYEVISGLEEGEEVIIS